MCAALKAGGAERRGCESGTARFPEKTNRVILAIFAGVVVGPMKAG